MLSAYQKVHDHFQKINDLQHVLAITDWDEASMMPTGGGEARGQALATLQVVIHEMTTDPNVAEWLDAAASENLDDWQSANLREIRRLYREATCMPSDLVRNLKQATSTAEQAWRRYRIDNNWDEPRHARHLERPRNRLEPQRTHGHADAVSGMGGDPRILRPPGLPRRGEPTGRWVPLSPLGTRAVADSHRRIHGPWTRGLRTGRVSNSNGESWQQHHAVPCGSVVMMMKHRQREITGDEFSDPRSDH